MGDVGGLLQANGYQNRKGKVYGISGENMVVRRFGSLLGAPSGSMCDHGPD